MLTSDLTANARVAIVGTSSKYTVTQQSHYIESYYVVRGNWVFVNLLLTCVTPQASSSWEPVIPDGNLPKVGGGMTTINPPAMTAADTNDKISLLFQSGILYANGGTAGKNYAVMFSYPIKLT